MLFVRRLILLKQHTQVGTKNFDFLVDLRNGKIGQEAVDKILLLLLIECTLIVNFFNIMVRK